MSRQELAESVNAYLWDTYKTKEALDETDIGKLERGENRWPRERRREAFRVVLHVSSDAELGFYINRNAQTAELDQPWTLPSPDSSSPGTLQQISQAQPDPSAALSLLTGAGLALHGIESAQTEDHTLAAPAGRFFDGQSVDTRVYPAVDDGRVLTAVPADFANSQFLRRPRRGLVVGVVEGDERPRGFGLDSRQARRRLIKAGPAARLLIPPAYILDDVTAGVLWAVVNLDEPLLHDDGLLFDLQQQLAQYEALPHSSAGRDLASDLTRVSQMWLGSDFCAQHILRHLADLSSPPEFWTREQRGEEASTWLLFRHKYDYLQAVTDRFSGGALSRAFCIPPETVVASPCAERILLILAAALMESFSIRVDVCADPEYAAVEGFVLDRGRQAIVANWVGADGIWQVGVTTTRPAIYDYGETAAYTSAHSVVPGRSPGQRLRAMADYLELDWPWLVQRCAQLGQHGCAGLAGPRSRLLSVAGLDRACRYLSEVGAATD
ncbi:XRE family transcriptional regulator [Micromonospora sp. Llam7]|uniref:XRE family transcriptional regulator n=1 Tax=Micromonospora tarapacensis TaxID=2835305 RepID=UPI001C831056|nr:XRE family transcriptional regulator [Micromonospora tarapacensis]MBX7267542.1 XRE family transcriptional regulator [Micromonospora tarapacensis]